MTETSARRYEKGAAHQGRGPIVARVLQEAPRRPLLIRPVVPHAPPYPLPRLKAAMSGPSVTRSPSLDPLVEAEQPKPIRATPLWPLSWAPPESLRTANWDYSLVLSSSPPAQQQGACECVVGGPPPPARSPPQHRARQPRVRPHSAGSAGEHARRARLTVRTPRTGAGSAERASPPASSPRPSAAASESLLNSQLAMLSLARINSRGQMAAAAG